MPRPNFSGRVGEKNIAAALRNVGLYFAEQVVLGETIYHGELRVDFVVTNLKDYPAGLVIESKWQDIRGTADEKFPYVVKNVQECYPLPVVIVVHGGGCRSGALQWFKEQIDGRKLIAIFNLEELTSWALRAAKQTPADLYNRSPE